jgi:hypothetical protein
MRKTCSALFAAIALFAFAQAHAAFIYDTGTPLYGQEQATWCGAATGQMILKQGGVTKTQTEVWNKIDASRVDPNFYCDPQGLATTLNAFDTVEKDSWKVFTDTNQDQIVEKLMESMVRSQRPIGLLVDNGNHWVSWVGFSSDIDPLKGDATLLTAILNDPLPVSSGTIFNLSAADFLARFTPNTFGTTYKGKYVAVAVTEPEAVLLLMIGLIILLIQAVLLLMIGLIILLIQQSRGCSVRRWRWLSPAASV